MAKAVDIAQYRKKKSNAKIGGAAKVSVMASLEHVLEGSAKRGFLLLPDSDVPRAFAISTQEKQLVGACSFNEDNKLDSYSLISMTTGKYVSRELGKSATTPVALTTLLFEELASL
jgi:hypothetical protein